jgi:hypothetical protein
MSHKLSYLVKGIPKRARRRSIPRCRDIFQIEQLSGLEEEILSGRRAIEIELSGRFAFESVALI